jgi:hypothetical protein
MKVHTLTKKSFIEDIKMDLVAAAVSSLPASLWLNVAFAD